MLPSGTRVDRTSLDEGFSILEALIAIALLTASVVTLASLLVLAATNTRVARNASSASILAQQKMEQLVATPWDALSLSPAGSLDDDVDGWVEFLDENGSLLGGGPTPQAGTAFIRRWSVTPLSVNPSQARVLVVQVTPIGKRSNAAADRLPGDAQVASVRMRR